MEKRLNTSTGTQSFRIMRTKSMIYVDKTAFIAEMIDSGKRIFFLSRPRRFGKSLTVSTLESLFLGRKELFRGLRVESRLDEEEFGPRPVIRLDMSKLTTTQGVEGFEKSLCLSTAIAAKSLGIELPSDYSSNDLFNLLLINCYEKYNSSAAILIDEYDSPVTKLSDKPDEADFVRKILREYYMQIKANDDLLSFVFVTGITKFVRGGLYSVFNNPSDISLRPEYGAITGFTLEEIERCYDEQLKEAALINKKPLKTLLDDINNFYNGFCFDGTTYVYNPYSTLLFLDTKMFDNFWFDSGTSGQLISYLNENNLTFEQFRGAEIDRAKILSPKWDGDEDPEIYLYQAGYLSLRPGPSDYEFRLDYPNTEVKMSISRLLVESFLGSDKNARTMRYNVVSALSNSDPSLLVNEINILLSALPGEHYKIEKRNEGFYCSKIFILFYILGLDPLAEKSGNLGVADFIINFGGRSWIIEVKMSPDEKHNIILANAALKQIKEKNYAGAYRDTVRLGLVIEDEKRAVTWWECEGGSKKNGGEN
ncbi:MAG: ATP-binding protein [Deltaproteobacteria bacterium]|jgi:hypothetical protein|nr:ATP-binding protein [Deltaproteobacteria bacterium]